MNNVILIGRTTNDVVLERAGNNEYTNFTLAVPRIVKNTQDADFIKCTAFGKTAETASKYVHKGDQIGVKGRIQTGRYTNKEGRTVYDTKIVVERLTFLTTKKSQETKEIKEEQTDIFQEFGDKLEDNWLE